ncbi:MAG: lactate utilization protein B [Planctomycetota bacterium]
MSGALRQRLAEAVQNRRVVDAVHLATWRKVADRAAAFDKLRHFEALRDRARQIRTHTLERLPDYLAQFVERATARGAHVHFAPDAAAACEIVTQIAHERGLLLAVKSKSMATEEIHLNDALGAAGVRVVETDLGEFIVQIDRDRPSHIITPIIHKDRRQVAEAMVRELGCPYSEDPTELTKIARAHLRDIFRRCDLGISGGNFGIAETGSIVLVTNEGNGRMTITRPRVHVALMGIEKMIPRLADLPVFLKLLARSSTGQPMGVYTTLITGPRRPGDPDGPEEVHIVLLDNGRSTILTGPLREVLTCVRCGACLNACPVYRNVGGHAYRSVYPGPIGSVLSPLLHAAARDAAAADQPAAGSGATPTLAREYAELPRASSLCGACRLACPVKIDLPELLVRLRTLTRSRTSLSKRLGMRAWAMLTRAPRLYRFVQRFAPLLPWRATDGWITRGFGPLADWTSQRDLPRPAARSFRRLWDAGLSHPPGDVE